MSLQRMSNSEIREMLAGMLRDLADEITDESRLRMKNFHWNDGPSADGRGREISFKITTDPEPPRNVDRLPDDWTAKPNSPEPIQYVPFEDDPSGTFVDDDVDRDPYWPTLIGGD